MSEGDVQFAVHVKNGVAMEFRTTCQRLGLSYRQAFTAMMVEWVAKQNEAVPGVQRNPVSPAG